MRFRRTCVQFLAPIWWLTTVTPVPGSLRAPGTHVVNRHTCKQISVERGREREGRKEREGGKKGEKEEEREEEREREEENEGRREGEREYPTRVS